MGSGTHCSKTDGFPGTHGTHANGATDSRISLIFSLVANIQIARWIQMAFMKEIVVLGLETIIMETAFAKLPEDGQEATVKILGT